MTTKWQDRYRRIFEQYTNPYDGAPMHPEFEEDVAELRKLDEKIAAYKSVYAIDKTQPLFLFMKKYRFAFTMYDFLYEYIVNNRIDYDLIKPGLFIVSEVDNTAKSDVKQDEELGDYLTSKTRLELFEGQTKELKLVISPDATNREIVEFIRKNQEFIRAKQKLLKTEYDTTELVRSRPKQERDYYIAKHLREGRTHARIAQMVNEQFPNETAITYRDVARIIKEKNL